MSNIHTSLEKITDLFEMPFNDLIYKAQQQHRASFDPNEIELCTLLSIKTGSCPEDCAYCPQSGHYQTGLQKEKLLDVEHVIAAAKNAKREGATRFCMGAAWRNPPEKNFAAVVEMVKAVKALELETCLTIGMLNADQAQALHAAGLDFYNHNLDTSPEYYEKIISTRTYADRLETIENIRHAGIKVCCGGIIGMGESREDRINFLFELSKLDPPPESVPINQLIPIPGTPLGEIEKLDELEFIRTIAVTRILLPKTMLRLSAGRADMSQTMQTLCFLAGANSIWLGDKLLTAKNSSVDADAALFSKLKLKSKTKPYSSHATT